VGLICRLEPVTETSARPRGASYPEPLVVQELKVKILSLPADHEYQVTALSFVGLAPQSRLRVDEQAHRS
jgi:hypothetical protein